MGIAWSGGRDRDKPCAPAYNVLILNSRVTARTEVISKNTTNDGLFFGIFVRRHGLMVFRSRLNQSRFGEVLCRF
jgi:hypothetical protein